LRSLFVSAPAPPHPPTLSLHDALPISSSSSSRSPPPDGAPNRLPCGPRPDCPPCGDDGAVGPVGPVGGRSSDVAAGACEHGVARDRKSTRLNSSHVSISYAVFCLKKKK